MPSLRGAINEARQKGALPTFASGRIGDLAHKLGLVDPVSVRSLIHKLGTLNPPRKLVPALARYDVKTLTLSGNGFLTTHSVRVRISMLGSSVLNGDGIAVPDTRDASTQVTSLAGGALRVVVDPRTVLPPLPLQDVAGNFITGVAPGEILHISATDGRDSQGQLDGLLWSNTLHITAP